MGSNIKRGTYSPDNFTLNQLLPGFTVDGMDVLATRETGRFALDYCRSGKGPLIMQLITYEYCDKGTSDPDWNYRCRNEIQKVRNTRDPITSFKEKILQADLVTADEIKAIDTAVKREINELMDMIAEDKE